MAGIYYALADMWNPGLRYRTTNYSTAEANRLYNEMQQLYDFLSELVV
jgi:hypothetical protein